MVTKKQLKNHLYEMNIPVYAGCKIKKSDIAKVIAGPVIDMKTKKEIKDGDHGIPLGKRYPKAKRKLSEKDIKELDKLFHDLNKTTRYTAEWDALCPKINKLLGYECVGSSMIPLDFIKKVINTLKKKLTTGGELSLERLNTFIKEKTPGDLMAFAKDAVEYFKQGKLHWNNELALLQNEYAPGGYEVIPWTFLKKQLSDITPEIEKQLPRAFVQKLS